MIKEKKKANRSKEVILLICIIFIIIIIDQLLKMWIQNYEEINIIPNILKFKISQDIKTSSTYIITNLIIIGIILRFLTMQNEFVTIKLKIFLSFIIAGGISNLMDRIIRGYVIEFIDFKQVVNLPIFSIADIFIVIGWISVVATFTAFSFKEWKSKKIKK